MDKGTFFGIGRSGGSYWKQRYPSDLIISIISAIRIDLAWTNHGSPTWDYTIIERSLDSYTWFEIGAVAPTASSYTDNDVAAYTTIYYYRIRYVKVATSSNVPALVSATVENLTPTKLRLVFDSIMDYASIPATTDFTVTDHTISSVVVVDYTVIITLSTPVIYFDTLKVSYVVPANNKLRVMNGNDVDALTNQAITNNVAEDGNTIAWYDSTDLSTITKNVSNQVSSWGDKLGVAARALLQAGADSIKPVWSATGVLFDGSNDFMKTAIFSPNFVQPAFIYIVINFKSFTSNDFVLDGNASGQCQMKNGFTTGVAAVKVSAGTEVGFTVHPANQKQILRVLYNGANSSYQVNDDAIVGSQNFGTTGMYGLTLARAGTSGTAYGHIEVQEIILRKSADSVAFSDSLMNYLKTKHTVTL